jgi:hypothetical protein
MTIKEFGTKMMELSRKNAKQGKRMGDYATAAFRDGVGDTFKHDNKDPWDHELTGLRGGAYTRSNVAGAVSRAAQAEGVNQATVFEDEVAAQPESQIGRMEARKKDSRVRSAQLQWLSENFDKFSSEQIERMLAIARSVVPQPDNLEFSAAPFCMDPEPAVSVKEVFNAHNLPSMPAEFIEIANRWYQLPQAVCNAIVAQ